MQPAVIHNFAIDSVKVNNMRRCNSISSSARIFLAKTLGGCGENRIIFSTVCRESKIKQGDKRSQILKMAENKEIPPQYDLNAKWDACLDLGVRRFVYSSATGAFAGLLLFRPVFLHVVCLTAYILLTLVVVEFFLRVACLGSPITRWASIAFGAGVGIGSAYSDCSQKFDGSRLTSPSVSETPVAKD